ncbi:MAG: hypothetical protein LRY52_10780 [Sulfurospirillum cavolei]|nr:hypothetical protein [Sulfurospirillum cavolei]
MAYTQHEFAFLQSINVLKSLGLEFIDLSCTKGFSKPYLSADFLERYTIINNLF